MTTNELPETNFIRDIVDEDLESGKHSSIVTRFPPEPNGFLHIGHATSICLNFGLARDYKGTCHLRFDDTNPLKEESKFAESIIEDVRWLGFDWGEHLYHASEYFDQLYEWAKHLIRDGKAYVDELSAEQIREYRGTLTEPGKNSPYRDRPVEENLDLIERMKNGEFEEGTYVVRAKIDMASPNPVMRDPTMYRIRKAEHHRTGAKWCIYPMYDFAHGLSDAIEGITHSLCTLEFENNRPLYDWFIANLPTPSTPRQIEFAGLNLGYTVLSKRVLRGLVEDGLVSGWDDPRMPTLRGLRRRGYTAASIRTFCRRIGLARRHAISEISLLESGLREELNLSAPRAMAVLRPIKLVITNYPEGQEETLDAVNNPEDESAGVRQVPFSRELYIEDADFREEAPKKYFRLTPGREVRLRWAYFVTCTGFVKDPDTGEVTEVHCTYDPETRGGDAPDGRKVKGTIHWVSAPHAVDAEVRLYDRLFSVERPGVGVDDVREHLNSESMEVLRDCKLEPSLRDAPVGEPLQFERMGYFCVDSVDSKPEALVFNRTVALRDAWAKIDKAAKAKA
ncbi:MAG: glutamine--tRNA ligase/YqeY domain fusion protein [Pseudomonadota bacterium]